MPKPQRRGKFTHKREPKEFEEEVIQIDRVTRVVKGGRKLRFRATVVIGNKKGKVGIGVGKSHEVTGAIQKAISKAKNDLITVTLDEATIPHETKIKYKSSKIILLPAAPGTGIIAGGAVRKVLELAGIKDILSKSLGTTNKIANSRATYMALKGVKETPMMRKKKATKAEEAKKEEKKPEPKAPKAPEKKEPAKKPAEKKAPAAKKPEPKSEKPKQPKE